MNTRYTETFLFLSRLSRRSNKGFALGFVLTAGVLMAATGAVMLLRSSSEQEKVIAQGATAQGKTSGEVAIARVQFLLARYPFLAQYDSSQWSNVANPSTDIGQDFEEHIEITNNTGGRESSCASESEEDSSEVLTPEQQQAEIISYVDTYTSDLSPYEQSGQSKWQQIDTTNSSQVDFRLISYNAPESVPGMGELKLQSMANRDKQFKESPTQLTVTIPVKQNETTTEVEEGDTPGLWTQQGKVIKGSGGGGNKHWAAHIWVSDPCYSQKPDDPATLEVLEDIEDETLLSYNGKTYKPPIVKDMDFPEFPEFPTDLPASQVNVTVSSGNGNGNGNGNKKASSYQDSYFSTVASVMNGFVDKAFTKIFGGVALAKNGNGKGKGLVDDITDTTNDVVDDITDTTNDIVDDLTNTENTNDTTNVGGGAVCGNNSANAANGSVFPRNGDTGKIVKVGNEDVCVYEYIWNQTPSDTTIQTVSQDGKRQKVIFYIKDGVDFDLKGNEKILKNCGDFDDNADLCRPTDFQIFAQGTGNFCLSGAVVMDAFVFAPERHSGVNGGPKGALRGTIWVKGWNTSSCGSNGNHLHVTQTGNWSDFYGVKNPEAGPSIVIGQPATVKTEAFNPDI
ncbi:hypothetical protein cce_3646 [Crocosphaera subtropica ATCC 51142]|uniref:Uncharacterized protein n=1 Tax=Crocosphaera subtropica (strain ATCC 51142 / BH68) TaxID=43989 RepID=B1X0V5_CROS5|nr:hypothetical protein [Crocosphaera subtropica]ACB52994.1 hypothetical protein cce_3646 [Crocosphaera subtropica ATCC 51142]